MRSGWLRFARVPRTHDGVALDVLVAGLILGRIVPRGECDLFCGDSTGTRAEQLEAHPRRNGGEVAPGRHGLRGTVVFANHSQRRVVLEPRLSEPRSGPAGGCGWPRRVRIPVPTRELRILSRPDVGQREVAEIDDGVAENDEMLQAVGCPAEGCGTNQHMRGR
jgi:hypothetical protein